jgi:tetratricopeptide (TPR) repeat protein
VHVELDPKLAISVLNPSGFDSLDVCKKLKTAGFQNVTAEKELRGIFDRFVKNPPAVLFLLSYGDPTLALELVRDLKSIAEMPNFPVLPVLKVDQRDEFLAVSRKYGIEEVILYPVHSQTLMEALATVVNRFSTSAEEKGIAAAKTALGAGDITGAIATFEAVRGANKSIRTELGLGQSWLQSDNKEKTAEFLSSAKIFDAENFQVRISELEQLVVSGSEFQNISDYIIGMAQQLEQTDRVAQVLKVFMRQKQYAVGLQVLESFGKKWIAFDARAVRLFWARFYHSVGETNEALAQLLCSVKEKVAGVEVYNMLGVLHSQREDWELAKNYYLEALRLSPGDYRLIFNVGLISERQQDFEQAQKYFQASLALAPSFEKALQHLDSVKKLIAAKAGGS